MHIALGGTGLLTMIDTKHFRDCLRTGRAELIERIQELCTAYDIAVDSERRAVDAYEKLARGIREACGRSELTGHDCPCPWKSCAYCQKV
jgi:hypothetical protein